MSEQEIIELLKEQIAALRAEVAWLRAQVEKQSGERELFLNRFIGMPAQAAVAARPAEAVEAMAPGEPMRGRSRSSIALEQLKKQQEADFQNFLKEEGERSRSMQRFKDEAARETAAAGENE